MSTVWGRVLLLGGAGAGADALDDLETDLFLDLGTVEFMGLPVLLPKITLHIDPMLFLR